MIVHLGCGDGKLTAALHTSDRFLVHGLDSNIDNVDAARNHIRSLGKYGRVFVEHHTGDRLPYIDNSVNLIVADTLGEVPQAEILAGVGSQRCGLCEIGRQVDQGHHETVASRILTNGRITCTILRTTRWLTTALSSHQVATSG